MFLRQVGEEDEGDRNETPESPEDESSSSADGDAGTQILGGFEEVIVHGNLHIVVFAKTSDRRRTTPGLRGRRRRSKRNIK